MKKFTIVMLLALVGIGSSASAYTYNVYNATDTARTVTIKPLGAVGTTYITKTIQPGAVEPFDFGSSPACLNQNSIEVDGVKVAATTLKCGDAKLKVSLYKGKVRVDFIESKVVGG